MELERIARTMGFKVLFFFSSHLDVIAKLKKNADSNEWRWNIYIEI